MTAIFIEAETDSPRPPGGLHREARPRAPRPRKPRHRAACPRAPRPCAKGHSPPRRRGAAPLRPGRAIEAKALSLCLALLLAALFDCSPARAGEWPTYLHDARRSGITEEKLALPLVPSWTYTPRHPPEPAWPPPAKADFWHHKRGLEPRVTYDRAFHTAVAKGLVFFGSSADDKVYALDAATGREKWSFFTDGPVRLAPFVEGGRVYIGSDDGRVFCLDAAAGSLLWSRKPKTPDRFVIGNGRMISVAPVRTGVVVEGGTVYFCAGIFPLEGVLLAALNARTGRIIYEKPADISPQGYMLASRNRLYVPTGRTSPVVFDREKGDLLGAFKGSAGAYALVTEDLLVYGPGDTGTLGVAAAGSRDLIATFPGLHMIVRGDIAYLHSESGLTAIDRRRYLELLKKRKKLKAQTQEIEKELKGLGKKASGPKRWKLEGERKKLAGKIAACSKAMAACTLWERACDYPYSLILAGDLLFAGGESGVAAFRADDGEKVWRAEVPGRAEGLAAAEGRLFVSTAAGPIICFESAKGGRKGKGKTADGRMTEQGRTEKAARGPNPDTAQATESGSAAGLVGHWDFTKENVSGRTAKDLAGGHDAAIAGAVRFAADPEALILDGSSVELTLAKGPPPKDLPKETLTATAWVAVDRPVDWGGIIGFIQDNGGFEKGWLLGTRGSHFAFALSTAGAGDGDGLLTYLQSKNAFEPGRWYHVAAVYDGKTQKIYVNGRLEGTSMKQSGRILYPARSFFAIGAYRDDNERYLLPGMLREVRLFNRALDAEEIANLYAAGHGLFPEPLEFTGGPDVKWLPGGKALLSFATVKPGAAAVAYGPSRLLSKREEDPAQRARHGILLAGFEPERTYFFRVVSIDSDGGKRASGLFSFEAPPSPVAAIPAAAPSPFAEDALTPLYEKAARWIVDHAGVRKGYCLVLDSGEGRLAYEIARLTEMKVIGVEKDAEKVEAARRALDRAGVYGTRVTIRQGTLARLPYPDFFANLIVCDETLVTGDVPEPAREMYRLLRPEGGVAAAGFFAVAGGGGASGAAGGGTPRGGKIPAALEGRLKKWIRAARPGEGKLVEDKGGLFAVIRRGPLPGAGEWTHTYADPGNTACSKDSRVKGKLALQWFGRPGPRLMIDRHHRNVPPLYKEGRIFIPGDEIVIAADAYNGTKLWDVTVPGSRRLGVFLDTSNLVVDEDFLYVAHGDRCDRFRVDNGAPAPSFVMPQAIAGEKSDWSYTARKEDLLFGTGQIPGASYTQTSYAADAALWYDNMSVVTSRYFFALDAKTGKTVWTYRSGILINTTLAIGGGRVYFIESKSPAALKNTLGRMPQRTFLEGDSNDLTALDAKTGKVLYRKKIDLSDCRLIAYLEYADGMLLLSGCHYVDKKLWYFFKGIDSATGKVKWKASHNSGYDPGGGHGEQNRHPTIVRGIAYAYPYAYRLKDGKRVEGYVFSRAGHGCGGVSGSLYSLFWRGGNPAMRDLRPGGGISKINHVNRPGCWINIIPAGGLVLMPEASSGCTCGFPLQTSVAYRPLEDG